MTWACRSPGLPWEGSEASQPKLADLATADVVICALDDTVGVVRAAFGQGPVCLVVNEERIVLGLVGAEALGPDDDRPVSEVMDEGPGTYRPHVPAAEIDLADGRRISRRLPGRNGS